MSAAKNANGRNRVAIVEPSPVVREGLRLLIEEGGEFAVTGMYDDVQSLVGEEADIVLLNPSVISGFRRFAVRSLLTELDGVPVAAILYGYVDAETLAGFDGSVDVYDDGQQLVVRLRSIIASFHGHHSHNATGEGADLSEREKEILVSVAKGLTNKEIADHHFISVHTVISHRKNITRKTGIKTIPGLTLYAMFNNLISQDELP
jgi:DNA-binding NarL/FixJ family response regulator